MAPRVPVLPEGRRVDLHDLLEIHAFLACQGPGVFQPATAWFRLMPDPDHGALVDWLLDPAHRDDASVLLGDQLASSLSVRGRDAVSALGGLVLPLVAVDAALGFQVTRCAAAAMPASVAAGFGECLQTLALAEGGMDEDAEESDNLARRDRLGCLLEALAALELPAEARARRFLALSQTLPSALVRDLVVPTALFPATPVEGATVLAEGNDAALRALLHGATTRPRGRAEFFEACKVALEPSLEAGQLVLGRVTRLLAAGDASARALESLVRAALLPVLERCAAKGAGPAGRVPPEADTWTLRLLAVVAPGLPEPHRSALCDVVVTRAGDLLRAGRVGTVDADAFVEALVNAAVLHADPDRPAAEVRRMLLDAAGALRLQLFASERPAESVFDVSMAFEHVVAGLGAEFRRRRTLALSLGGILPIVADLSAPGNLAQAGTWAD